MTNRELLERAREVWMAAALRDQRQFHVGGPDTGTTGDRTDCAGTLAIAEIGLAGESPAGLWKLMFVCPEHGPRAFSVIHFNNVRTWMAGHNWDWLTLARKLGVSPYDLLAPDSEAV